MPTAPTFPRPLMTVDIVIFAVRQNNLEVLLVQRPGAKDEPFPGQWALPGGFVDIERDRDLEGCALRKLKDKAGIDAPYLEQLGSWGNATRDPRGWSATHAYFALISLEDREAPARSGAQLQDTRWAKIDRNGVSERLAFDHSEILKSAVSRLRNKVEYTSLPAYLMPKEFTLTELQRMHEIVLGRSLEKKAFRTRILASDLLQEVPRHKQGANRPAQLYRVKNRRRPIYFARALVRSGSR